MPKPKRRRGGRPRTAALRPNTEVRKIMVGPTKERLSQGDLRLVVMNEGSGRQAGITEVYRSVVDWSALDLTEDQRSAANWMRAIWGVPCPGEMPNPDAIGGGGQSDGPQATEAGLLAGEAKRLEARVHQAIGIRHSALVVSVIINATPLAKASKQFGYTAPAAAKAIRAAMQRVWNMEGMRDE